MVKYESCGVFTQKGLAKFKKVLFGEEPDTVVDLEDMSIATPISDTKELIIEECASAKDLAQAIVESLKPMCIHRLLGNTGLWCWLTFVFRHQLFVLDDVGHWRAGEIHRWYASHPGDWRKGQRHMVRMSVQLLATFGTDADHLLCSKPSVLPEIREQLTSQQDMFDPSFQRLARTLYFDNARGKLKAGAGGKGPGSPRRLAQVRRQFDMTWDLAELDLDAVMKMLPSEFDRFKV